LTLKYFLYKIPNMAKHLEREPSAPEATYIFVGEKRSNRSITVNAVLGDRKYCSKNLIEALEANGINPENQTFLNLFCDGDGLIMNDESLKKIKESIKTKATVVGMGKSVQKCLEELGIKHLKLVHPAARGSIRKTERYAAHVAEILKK
jgi:hypothetical protein